MDGGNGAPETLYDPISAHGKKCGGYEPDVSPTVCPDHGIAGARDSRANVDSCGGELVIVLKNPVTTFQLVMSGAEVTNKLPWVVSWVDILTATQAIATLGESDGVSNGTGAVTLVPAPAEGHTRTIKSVTIYNADTTGAQVAVQLNSSGTTRILLNPLLSAGDTLEYSAAD